MSIEYRRSIHLHPHPAFAELSLVLCLGSLYLYLCHGAQRHREKP